MSGGQEIPITQERDSGGTTISVRGQLDIATVPQLRRVLQQLGRRHPPALLRVDLLDVSFLGAGALGLLAATASRLQAHGARLVVYARPQHVRLFRLCELGHLLIDGAPADRAGGAPGAADAGSSRGLA